MTNPSEVTKDAKGVSREQMLELATAIAKDPFYYFADIADSDRIKEIAEAIRALIAKGNEPGDEGRTRPTERGGETSIANPPGPTMTAMTDDEALAVVQDCAILEEGPWDKWEAALAHLRKRLSETKGKP